MPFKKKRVKFSLKNLGKVCFKKILFSNWKAGRFGYNDWFSFRVQLKREIGTEMDFFQPTAKKRYLFASLSAKSEKR
jgi:hypothetical protein